MFYIESKLKFELCFLLVAIVLVVVEKFPKICPTTFKVIIGHSEKI